MVAEAENAAGHRQRANERFDDDDDVDDVDDDEYQEASETV